MAILSSRCVLERASVDEAYMDITLAAAAVLQQLRLPDGALRPPPTSLAGWHVAGAVRWREQGCGLFKGKGLPSLAVCMAEALAMDLRGQG